MDITWIGLSGQRKDAKPGTTCGTGRTKNRRDRRRDSLCRPTDRPPGPSCGRRALARRVVINPLGARILTGIALELELELEKSDRYCYLLTAKGKTAESLYKSPDFLQMTIKSFFKTI